METDLLWKKLAEVFEQVFGEPIELAPHTTAADVYGWDSVKNIELMVAVERAFKTRFTTAEISRLKNVGELAALLAPRS